MLAQCVSFVSCVACNGVYNEYRKDNGWEFNLISRTYGGFERTSAYRRTGDGRGNAYSSDANASTSTVCCHCYADQDRVPENIRHTSCPNCTGYYAGHCAMYTVLPINLVWYKLIPC